MIKKIVILSFLLIVASSAYASMTYDELNAPKESAYRVGTTDDVENKFYIETKSDVDEINLKENNSRKIDELTYADLSIKYISKDIISSVDADYNNMQGDLSILWQGAATKSDTVKYAIYKLSHPDEDKPNNASVKKVLSAIANMSTLVGAGIGNPMMSSLSMISGSTLGIFAEDAKSLNYKYTRVKDADMIILVRKIDELQQRIVDSYFDYITAKEYWDKTTEIAKRRYDNYYYAQDTSKEIILIIDAYYRDAVDTQMKARNDFYDKRAKLEQLVGTDILNQFEKSLESKKK